MAKTLHELIGRRKTTSSKSGRDCYNYYFASDFSAYDEENGECEGRTVTQEFCYEDFPCSVGDMCELEYDKGFQDKAVLCGINVVRSGKPFEDKKKAAETK